MKGQPAKILGGWEVRQLLAAGRRRRYPDRNSVIVLLSVKAGLRACEIGRLTWPMVSDASGKIGTVIELPARAAKKGSGRRIPIHPHLRRALVERRPRALAVGAAVLEEFLAADIGISGAANGNRT